MALSGFIVCSLYGCMLSFSFVSGRYDHESDGGHGEDDARYDVSGDFLSESKGSDENGRDGFEYPEYGGLGGSYKPRRDGKCRSRDNGRKNGKSGQIHPGGRAMDAGSQGMSFRKAHDEEYCRTDQKGIEGEHGARDSPDSCAAVDYHYEHGIGQGRGSCNQQTGPLHLPGTVVPAKDDDSYECDYYGQPYLPRGINPEKYHDDCNEYGIQEYYRRCKSGRYEPVCFEQAQAACRKQQSEYKQPDCLFAAHPEILPADKQPYTEQGSRYEISDKQYAVDIGPFPHQRHGEKRVEPVGDAGDDAGCISCNLVGFHYAFLDIAFGKDCPSAVVQRSVPFG